MAFTAYPRTAQGTINSTKRNTKSLQLIICLGLGSLTFTGLQAIALEKLIPSPLAV